MNKEKMDELRGLSRNLDSATFRVDQISKNITKALKSEPLGPRDQNEVGDLTGQDLLNALTEAEGQYFPAPSTTSRIISSVTRPLSAPLSAMEMIRVRYEN